MAVLLSLVDRYGLGLRVDIASQLRFSSRDCRQCLPPLFLLSCMVVVFADFSWSTHKECVTEYGDDGDDTGNQEVADEVKVAEKVAVGVHNEYRDCVIFLFQWVCEGMGKL